MLKAFASRLLIILLAVTPIFAKSSAKVTPKSSGPVHVHGYTRKDGKHVQPYNRRAPGTAPKTKRKS
jgi:hypothetical protein